MQPARNFKEIFFDFATVGDGSHLQQLILEGPGNIENVSQWLAGHINDYTRNDSQALASIARRLAHFTNRSSSDPQILAINGLAHTVFNREIQNNSNNPNRSNHHASDPDQEGQEGMDLSSFDSDSNPNNSNSNANSAPSSNRAVKRGDLTQKNSDNRSSKKRVKQTNTPLLPPPSLPLLPLLLPIRIIIPQTLFPPPPLPHQTLTPLIPWTWVDSRIQLLRSDLVQLWALFGIDSRGK